MSLQYRTLGACLAIIVAALGISFRPGWAAPAASPSQRELVDRYCIGCHNQKLRTAGLALDKLDFTDVAAGAATWEKVVHQIRAGAMPPPGLPRPDAAILHSFVAGLEAKLDDASRRNPNPGRVAVHRLNQTEYGNAIRDLLGLEIDARSLLAADDVDEHGFDNIAGVLSVSPALLERYLSAAHRVSRLAVGDPAILPAEETYEIPKLLVQDDRVSEDLPFGSRGGIAIRHFFPLDGEYVIKIRLRRQLYGYIIGFHQPQQVDLRLDGKRIRLFTVGGTPPGRPTPDTWAGNVPGDAVWEEYTHTGDAGLEVRLPLQAGPRLVQVSMVRDPWEPEGVLLPPEPPKAATTNPRFNDDAAVDTVSIAGPYKASMPQDTPSRRRIFVCRPSGNDSEEDCARRILSPLARRAYRRPVEKADLDTLLEFFRLGRKQGTFDAGIEQAIERLLADPEFLFRIVRVPTGTKPGSAFRISGLELASRLSFFLWSSLPDDTLLDLAVSGKLNDPPVLESEVKRMLADPRSKALLENFATRSLDLVKLRSTVPDPDVFPEFEENLRQAFQQETELFLQSQLREDRPALELLTAKYTFVNERLARHYGMNNVHGSQFRRVAITDPNRAGLLGQASVLTVTSYPNRTSPVIRGKWVMDNILGVSPPPPPPDVPALKEKGEKDQPASVRARLEEHRKNPACAGCHARMDPLGFALENFDAIGRWRIESDGVPVDARTTIAGGPEIDGVTGLRNMLLQYREQFVATMITKMMTYAVGREMEYYDRPAIRKIARDAAANQYRWSSIIQGVVRSLPFQMSVAGSPAAHANPPGRSAE